MLGFSKKQSVETTKQPIVWFESWVTKLKQFSTFSKLLRGKQPVDFTKQQVVFHLVGKTLDFKKVLNYINFRFNKGVDHILFYQNPS